MHRMVNKGKGDIFTAVGVQSNSHTATLASTFVSLAIELILDLSGAQSAMLVQREKIDGGYNPPVFTTLPQKAIPSAAHPAIQALLKHMSHNRNKILTWHPNQHDIHQELLKQLGVGRSAGIHFIDNSQTENILLLFDIPDEAEDDNLFDTVFSIFNLRFRNTGLGPSQPGKADLTLGLLKKNCDQLYAFFDNKLVGMMLLDRNGYYTQVNQQWANMTGYSRQELLRMNYRDITHPEDVHISIIDQLIKNSAQKTIQLEKRYVRKDGSIFWASLSGSGLYDDGQFASLVVMINDISAQKHAAEQLQQRCKMEAIGIMASGIAHNFNNNLTIVLGNIELSQFKISDPEICEQLADAKTAVLRSRNPINQLMNYSRTRKQDKEALELCTVVDELLALIQVTIPSTVILQKNICAATKQLVIEGDVSQLQECLLNLCNNAVYAMQQ
jgi:PAS domain S-box-containing protein